MKRSGRKEKRRKSGDLSVGWKKERAERGVGGGTWRIYEKLAVGNFFCGRANHRKGPKSSRKAGLGGFGGGPSVECRHFRLFSA